LSEVTFTWEQVKNAYFKGLERCRQFSATENKKLVQLRKAEGMPKEYSSLQEIVDQLESCGYETSDQYHYLENNTAFIALKERAAAEQAECAKLQTTSSQQRLNAIKTST